MQKAVFVSDVHLSEEGVPSWGAFLKFLQSISRENVTDLFLVGDIFDLWVGDHDYFKVKFSVFLKEFSRIKKQGIEIHMFEGNHDLYLQPFFGDQLGFKIYSGPTHFEINGLNVRVEHGDEMDPTDHGYIFLRSFLRMPPIRWINVNMPEKWVTKIGEKASEKSRAYTSKVKTINEEQAREVIRVHAENAFMNMPFDLIITGHVHVRDEYVFDVAGIKGKSINLGSWFIDPQYFYVDNNSQVFKPIS